MEVKLLSATANIIDVLYTACRTCYSKQTPLEIFNKDIKTDEKISLIKKVMDSGHHSVAEHVNFTFAISGITRACLAQISRHRFCSLSVQSQRYVEIKENVYDLKILRAIGTYQDKLAMVTKYFEVLTGAENELQYFLNVLVRYLEMTEIGIKPEEARSVLPNATKTNMILTCNLRELIHICNLRLCTHAQEEIRRMVGKMKSEVLLSETNCWMLKYLVSNCKNCTDFRGCLNKEGKK